MPVIHQTIIPDWLDRVDQSDPSAVARFISSFPNVKVISSDEQNEVLGTAIELAYFFGHTVTLDRRGFTVELIGDGTELYNTMGGTHALYRNFAVLWSVRGPGDSPTPRPMFLFWDGAAVFWPSAEAA